MNTGGERTVALLKERLRPAPAAEIKALRQLLADLDHPQAKIHRAAQKKLANQVANIDIILFPLLEDEPSEQMEKLVKELLKTPRVVASPEVLRGMRAVQVLEQIASKEARQILTSLAAGAAEDRLTLEADAALQRLK